MNKFQYLVGNQTRSVIHSSSLFFFYIWNKLAWEAKTIILLRDWAPDFQASRLMWFIGFSWSFAVVEDKKPAWVSFQPPPTPNAIHSVFSPNHRLRVALYAINTRESRKREWEWKLDEFSTLDFSSRKQIYPQSSELEKRDWKMPRFCLSYWQSVSRWARAMTVKRVVPFHLLRYNII